MMHTTAEVIAYVAAAIGSTCIIIIRAMRAKVVEARRLGYEDGRDAERSVLLRELRSNCDRAARTTAEYFTRSPRA